MSQAIGADLWEQVLSDCVDLKDTNQVLQAELCEFRRCLERWPQDCSGNWERVEDVLEDLHRLIGELSTRLWLLDRLAEQGAPSLEEMISAEES
jgi:hypothetical protein